ncbi:hypothetical protein ATANTOWER_017524 [Ataeniobius toweri]|uniref:Uncharacterized protein n=1 Tax=Ataeniobius toweri TaxID=208326 RepID=A0ABU7CCE5_9TELE|nr:hypothetical protein [Ataeniobius toweri]
MDILFTAGPPGTNGASHSTSEELTGLRGGKSDDGDAEATPPRERSARRQEARVPGENPRIHRKNIQTPCRSTPG